ncbi:MAG TPA: GH1 family beta-glucosidase [Meiothermus sp.]|nr:GH1 family beta-glucosidase [Meiothermus sp.]
MLGTMGLERNDFPRGFIWGTATASYQIEGAVHEDGRGQSIWDTFSHTPGKTHQNHSGDMACDHYHRYAEDVRLMAELGMNAYRFSLAWPRILPQGRGQVNEKGLGFYDRLVDELLKKGITPWVTLYHWDLPQTLQEAGGWPNRATIEAYLEYASVATRHLGDRVKHWITFNEPWVFCYLGYGNGLHAPGVKEVRKAVQATHHVLLAHGRAVPLIRANVPGAKVGLTNNYQPTYPASQNPQDIAAARRVDGFFNRWFTDPIYGRGYPEDILAEFRLNFPRFLQGPLFPPRIQAGDMESIAAPIDFLGVNFYSRFVARHKRGAQPLNVEQVKPEGDYTHMGWEVYPQSLTDLLVRLAQDYPVKELHITENGAAYPDVLENEEIHDPGRTRYYQLHLEACLQAIRQGAPLKGYFAWSLMDNFEWAEGYDKRFGLYYTDYATQRRILKDSGKWWKGFLGRSS